MVKIIKSTINPRVYVANTKSHIAKKVTIELFITGRNEDEIQFQADNAFDLDRINRIYREIIWDKIKHERKEKDIKAK